MTDKFERLPIFAKPEWYRLHLKPNLETFECKGRVEIDINFEQKSKFVKFHSACDELSKIDLTLENGKEWSNLKFSLDKKWSTVNVEFPSELEPQKAKLSIDYKTEINKNLRGFYRSSYKDQAGDTKYLASTQFESDSARFAFPSFDEPIYKAKFDIELEVDEKLTALSNMNVVGEKPSSEGKKLVKFATTPIMSTYLVAFIVGEFDFIETKYGQDNIPIRLYTVIGKEKEHGKMALEVARKAMEWYEDWFDYKSPLPKVDLIAIPDFSMGAMENWGLVTFREMLLLVNEHTSQRLKQFCALIVAHELGHFWFGNLTTPVWWGQLWLKEGFANFMEYLFCEKNYPELKTALNYVSDISGAALSHDGLKSTHKIEVEINDPNELTSIYDAITYEKSNSIIRMLYYYLGEDTFREGLRLFIKRFAYKNATTADLWLALSDASKQDINKLMSNWTQQEGYPFISVEERKPSQGKSSLELRQTRYLADGSIENENVWQIPITVVRASNPEKIAERFLMTEREQSFILESDDEWIKLNASTSGFYRVSYSDEMLKKLLGAVHSGKLGILDRYGLASDIYAFIRSGKVPASQLLALTAALVNENEYLVWQCVLSGINAFGNVFDRHDPELKSKLDNFICNILEPVAARLGWEAESGEDVHKSQLRGLILNQLSRAGHTQTIEIALKKFDEYVKNGATLHPDLRSMIFGTAARKLPNGSEQLLKIFETSDAEVQRNALIATIQTTDPEMREKIFQYAVFDSKVRPQDLHALFLGCSSIAKGQDFSWGWFKKNHGKLIEIFGGPTEGIFIHCFESAACHQSSEEFAQEFEAFFNSAFDDEAKSACDRTFKNCLEEIRLNAQLYKNNRDSIAEFLTKNN